MRSKLEKAQRRDRINPTNKTAKIIISNDIDTINFEKGEYHYIYKDFDFLYKNQGKENLVVLFHGSVRFKSPRRVIFRGYNYDFENADVLCISDYLIKSNDDLFLSWYLSTDKHNCLEIYTEIINRILTQKLYNKIIFTGTSGGGYPSLIFGSIFKAYSLISNSQIYLDNYIYFDEIIKLLNVENDDIEYDIEKFILDNGPPLKTILYTNIRDGNHYNNHSIPFKNFMKEKFPNKIETCFFKGRDPPANKCNHHIQFPNENTYQQVINNFLIK